MYLGIYTREEKMCPQDAVFLRDSLESVVSSERLFGKRSFSTASATDNTVAYFFDKKSLTTRFGQDGQKHFDFLRRSPCSL